MLINLYQNKTIKPYNRTHSKSEKHNILSACVYRIHHNQPIFKKKKNDNTEIQIKRIIMKIHNYEKTDNTQKHRYKIYSKNTQPYTIESF